MAFSVGRRLVVMKINTHQGQLHKLKIAGF